MNRADQITGSIILLAEIVNQPGWSPERSIVVRDLLTHLAEQWRLYQADHASNATQQTWEATNRSCLDTSPTPSEEAPGSLIITLDDDGRAQARVGQTATAVDIVAVRDEIHQSTRFIIRSSEVLRADHMEEG